VLGYHHFFIQMDPFETLPSEIVLHILYFVPTIAELGRVSMVCRKFRERVELEVSLWKMLALEWWGIKGFNKKVNLGWAVRECISVDISKDWKWFAKCFSRNMDDGFSCRVVSDDDEDWISIGELKSGKLHGWGVEVASSGTLIRMGYFDQQKLNGSGSSIWDDGERYVGDFDNDIRSGSGVYTWADGVTYSGGFKDCRKHGQGLMVWSQLNFQFQGNWEEDQPQDEKAVHPAVRESINQQICTASVTKDSKRYGQFFYECDLCGEAYCLVCWDTCHQGEGHLKIRAWSGGKHCVCAIRDTCTSRIKRQRIE